ncbi:hypothetical protein [Actinomadura roseirufa]|uniref:hypothetical protein n=1 Tax=Actinomadura roseirufa TaxID=2094049 RepID=UPI0010418A7C|nr:hypothetical protein [Actinomadura roseirufa]
MNDLGYEPKTLHPEKVRERVRGYSAAIDTMAALPKGERMPHGPLIDLSARGVKRGFYMSDVWSIYSPSRQDVSQGYDRIKSALPGAGWKIVHEGPDAAGKKDPQLRAEHQVDHFTLRVELISDRPMLYITVDSLIFIAPPDVDLNTFH